MNYQEEPEARRGLEGHRRQKTTEKQGSHVLGLRPHLRGIPEMLICRTLMLMWSCAALA